MRKLLFWTLLLSASFVNAQIHSVKINEIQILDSTNQEYKVSLINYKTRSEILRYKKMEMGLSLPLAVRDQIYAFVLTSQSDENNLNPFVEWDLDVEGHFTHIETGDFKTVEGYYHREYTVNSRTDDWNEIPTDYPMRIRFAPPKNGQWKGKIICKIRGKEVFASQQFEFQVIESGDAGYVSVHPNKKNLMRNGEIIYAFGHNFAGPNEHAVEWGGSEEYLGKKLFSNTNTTKATNTREWAAHHEKMEAYFDQGGKFVRSIQSPWATLIEFEKRGNYFDRLHYAWEQDKLMDMYDKYDAMVQFNMLMHTTLTIMDYYGMHHWDWERWEIWGNDTVYYEQSKLPINAYNTNPKKEGGKLPHHTFLEEEDLKYHEQRTRYYIARYGYSTKIMEFELLSEPFNVDTHEKPKMQPYYDNGTTHQKELFRAIENYHDRLSTYIKKNLQHTHHLIGVDYAMGSWHPYESAMYIDKSYTLENIDIIGINFYSKSIDKYITSKSGSNNAFGEYENSKAKAFNDFHRWVGKPVILSEYGDGDGSQYCSEYQMHAVDAVAASYTGVCGHFLWDGRMNSERQIWPFSIQNEKFFNSKEVITIVSRGNGQWIQGRQQAKISNNKVDRNILELQYILSNDRYGAIGYVRNRSFNVYTNRVNDSYGCKLEFPDNSNVARKTDIRWNTPKKKQRLFVEGTHPKATYEITWYSIYDGSIIGNECVKSGKNNLILKYPELKITERQSQRPAVYFKLQLSNCSTK